MFLLQNHWEPSTRNLKWQHQESEVGFHDLTCSTRSPNSSPILSTSAFPVKYANQYDYKKWKMSILPVRAIPGNARTNLTCNVYLFKLETQQKGIFFAQICVAGVKTWNPVVPTPGLSWTNPPASVWKPSMPSSCIISVLLLYQHCLSYFLRLPFPYSVSWLFEINKKSYLHPLLYSGDGFLQSQQNVFDVLQPR